MANRLYIKIDDNGDHIGHPRFESNLKQIFIDHDFDSGPPSGYMLFIRSEPPLLTPYQKFNEAIGGNIAIAFKHNGLSYDIVDGVYKDVWHVLDMTAEEIAAKQKFTKDEWVANGGYASWVFNETNCAFDAPVAYPEDGQVYTWDEDTVSWVVVTPE
tara:strand:- start:3302 stop:3772 length:471 start_codon:yes stop_codon:yes gene_type:complete